MTSMADFQLQRGMSLIEALVTMTLTVILGLGVAYISGQSAVAQKDMNVLGLAVGQMRNEVFSGGCGGESNKNLTLTLVSADQKTGIPAVNVMAKCKSQIANLQIKSDSESFNTTFTTRPNYSVSIPESSTLDNKISKDLFGGEVSVGTVAENGDDNNE